MTRWTSLCAWAALALLVNVSHAGAESPPYPPSSMIRGVTWHVDTQQTFGKGSDQWPMTWADDGGLYAAWGDGWGWNHTAKKYSLGVTRIDGRPPDLSGDDLFGIGPGSGVAKPEALIAYDDKLYMFWTSGDSKSATDNTRTALSTDGGETWSLGESKAFPYVPDGFRVRGICEFGRGYEGARDEYVYVYFGMNAHADIYLARVPQEHLFDAARYEWFQSQGEHGGAAWSASFDDKQPAFHDDNAYIWHVGVSYNTALDRYLLVKPHYGEGDVRGTPLVVDSHVSSIGLFDAPAPWGPWTTVDYQDRFIDDLVKFSYMIPTKFISADGKTFWLAFSGWPEYDSVTFLKATLAVDGDSAAK